MSHNLNLPELPAPREGEHPLHWAVNLSTTGNIEVSLVRLLPCGPGTVLELIGYSQDDAESMAHIAWQNYLAVHGAPKPQGRPIRDEPQA